jgi:hypothetical protein
MLDAVRRAEQLCLLFRFANAGQLGPLYIEGKSISADPLSEDTVAAMAMVWQTTPIEQLGHSWINTHSDLATYLGCFPALERMLKVSHWEETLFSILTWYEQAMQDKAWQIVANALGTLLETLSYMILVLDESNPNDKANYAMLFDFQISGKCKTHWNLGHGVGQQGSAAKKRTKLLLERIGLTTQRGHNDVTDVSDFLHIRNDATHPKTTGQGQTRRDEVLTQARMWVDEILLWRLGYNGMYMDRRQNQFSTEPRYDLKSRDPNW